MSRAGAIICLGDARTLAEVAELARAFAANLPLGDAPAPTAAACDWAAAPRAPAADEGFALPTQVNYVGKGGRLFAVGEWCRAGRGRRALPEDRAFWDTVRVIGGAYGGMCRFAPDGPLRSSRTATRTSRARSTRTTRPPRT